MSASSPEFGVGEQLRAPDDSDVQELLRLAKAERESALAEASRERARRRRALYSLVLLIIVVLGISSWSAWRYVHVRENQSLEIARRATVERDIDQALAELRHCLAVAKQGNDPGRELINLEAAIPLLERAESLVAEAHSSEEQKVEVAAARNDLDSTLREVQGMSAIDRIRLDNIDAHERRLSAKSIAQRYEEALTGLGVDASPQHATTTSGMLRTHLHRERLLAALSDWRIVEPDEKKKYAVAYLLRIAEAREMYRSQIRDAIVRRDDALVEKLLKSPAMKKQPAIYLCRLAMILQSMNREAQAIEVLKGGLHRHPGDFWLNVELGGIWLHRKPNGPAQAREYFKAAVAIRPQNATANYLLGVTAQRAGDWSEASAAFGRAIENDAAFGDAHLHLCAALRERDEFDGAIEHGRQAMELAPSRPEPPTCLAAAYVRQGKFADAVELYRKSLAIDAGHLPALLGLGELLREEDALDEAELLLKRAIAAAPDKSVALNQYGLLLQSRNDLPGAAATYRKALDLERDDPAASVFLGIVRMKQGERDEALRWFQAAIERDPKYAPAYVQIGLDHLARSELREAVSRLQQAVDVDPRCPAAQFHLGCALEKSGDKEGALKALRRAAELQPRWIAAHFCRGKLALNLGLLEEATEALESAARLSPINHPLFGTIHTYLHRARQRIALPNRDRA